MKKVDSSVLYFSCCFMDCHAVQAPLAMTGKKANAARNDIVGGIENYSLRVGSSSLVKKSFDFFDSLRLSMSLRIWAVSFSIRFNCSVLSGLENISRNFLAIQRKALIPKNVPSKNPTNIPATKLTHKYWIIANILAPLKRGIIAKDSRW